MSAAAETRKTIGLVDRSQNEQKALDKHCSAVAYSALDVLVATRGP